MSSSSSPEGPGSVSGAPYRYCVEEAPEGILEALAPYRDGSATAADPGRQAAVE
jgi:hypothetical protein